MNDNKALFARFLFVRLQGPPSLNVNDCTDFRNLKMFKTLNTNLDFYYSKYYLYNIITLNFLKQSRTT